MYACFAALAVLAGVCAFVGFHQVGKWLRARLCSVAVVAFSSAAIIATCEAQKRRYRLDTWQSKGQIFQIARGVATGLIEYGYTPKWLDEFKDFK